MTLVMNLDPESYFQIIFLEYSFNFKYLKNKAWLFTAWFSVDK